VELNPGPGPEDDTVSQMETRGSRIEACVNENLKLVSEQMVHMICSLENKLTGVMDMISEKFGMLQNDMTETRNYMKWLGEQQEQLTFSLRETDRRCEAYCQEPCGVE